MRNYNLMLLDILTKKNKVTDSYIESINNLQKAILKNNIKLMLPESNSSSEIMKVILADKIKLIKYYDKLGGS